MASSVALAPEVVMVVMKLALEIVLVTCSGLYLVGSSHDDLELKLIQEPK